MDSDRRKARVKRLKLEMRILKGLAFVIPWAMVIVLYCNNYSYRESLAEKDELISRYIDQMEALTKESAAEYETPDVQPVTEVTGPEEKVYTYEGLPEAEIEALQLSEEELYDGYRKVYLTFDDGPSTNTDAILDVLNEYNVKATFFVIYKEGRDNEALYRRIADEGHTLGMHSCTHVYSQVYASEEAFTEDTETLRNFLYMVTGIESEFYRFPGGSSNKVSDIDMRTFCKILNDKGIVYYDWNVSSQDAHSPILSKDEIVRNATKNLESYTEAVILFHDTASKTTTVEALPEIIEYIQSMDHTVILPITKETNPITHISVEE